MKYCYNFIVIYYFTSNVSFALLCVSADTQYSGTGGSGVAAV